ncbi:restriction endonuclease subunit S [Vreelandella stevensii]|uniref:restriction endonuclease subunit S n=1 Tax=Vreelandella stevensii TaxID=502821 RepID=UPI0003197818|nr:restriction endonuclease subunit S [Halomonas stevensii]
MEFSDRPSAWLPVKLIDIATLNMGQSPSSSDVNNSGDGIAFFQGKAEFGKLNPTARKFCTAPKKIAESGDILLSVRAPVGPTNVANRTTAIGRGLAAIRAENKAVDPRFLLHYFRCIEPWMSQQGTGTTFKAVSGGFLKELNAVLPPLAEQKVIADKLDTLLAQVENTKARLERIPQILKRFRQSVLAAAVSGRLTEELKPWESKKLDECFECIDGDRGPNYPKKHEYLDSGYCLFLSTKNVRPFGFGFTDQVFISKEKDEILRKGRLTRGDLVITTRGTLGHVASFDESVPFEIVRINSGMLILRKKQPDYSNDYFKILIASPLFRKFINDQSTGSAQPQLPAKILKGFILPIPSPEEQTEIVRRVDQLFAHADRIEQQVNNALARVNSLTQSILAKAFRGELTEQWRKDNPELISGENSAQALMERIKAERAAMKPAKKTRQKRTTA